MDIVDTMWKAFRNHVNQFCHCHHGCGVRVQVKDSRVIAIFKYEVVSCCRLASHLFALKIKIGIKVGVENSRSWELILFV